VGVMLMNSGLLKKKQTKNPYIKADERILNVAKQLDSRAPLEYLRGLAHNIRYKLKFHHFSNFHPLFTLTNISDQYAACVG